MLQIWKTALSLAVTVILFLTNFFELSARHHTSDSEPAVISIMVVYTDKAEKWALEHKGGIDNTITRGIDLTQLTLDNSGLSDIELKLVYSAKVDYEETGDSQTDLHRLRSSGNGYMDPVHQWRERYQADLVKLLTVSAEVSGRALQPGRIPSSHRGFSLTRVQRAATLDFAHEIGHNLGFHHSRNQNTRPAPSGGGIFEFSTGWRWTGNDGKGYVSVMTYPEGDTRVPHYSNPDITHKGVPTGSYTGKYAPADNARSLRKTIHYFSNYMAYAHEDDSLAVLELYNSTNGEHWQDNSGWFTDEPLRNWHGLNVMKRIVELNFRNNNMNGIIPSEIGTITELERINLSNNELTGGIPHELTNLSLLKWLNLSDNELYGTIPPEIEDLSQLKQLNLSGNELTGTIPSELGNLSDLEILHLSDNELHGPIPLLLMNLENLREFRFQNLDVCIPVDSAFQAWFDNLNHVEGKKNYCSLGFSLNAPEHESEIELNGYWQDKISFSWKHAGDTLEQDPHYVWMLDHEDNFEEPVLTFRSDNDGADNTLTLTYEQLDNFLADRNVKIGETFSAYWTVEISYRHVSQKAEGIHRIDFVRGEVTNPDEFVLGQNYPNPFNANTRITYQLPKQLTVSLEVYNLLGKHITTLVNETQSAGVHDVTFSAENLSSGVYIYHIQAGDFEESRRMMLVN